MNNKTNKKKYYPPRQIHFGDLWMGGNGCKVVENLIDRLTRLSYKPVTKTKKGDIKVSLGRNIYIYQGSAHKEEFEQWLSES
jgi:hypothetical protein